MTEHEEKAQELINELFERSLDYHDACIAASYLVEEILKSHEKFETSKQVYGDYMEYWEKVKEALDN